MILSKTDITEMHLSITCINKKAYNKFYNSLRINKAFCIFNNLIRLQFYANCWHTIVLFLLGKLGIKNP